MRRIERPDPAEPGPDWPLRRLRRLAGLLVVAMFLVAVCSSVAEASVIETSSGELGFYARKGETNNVTVWQRLNGDLGLRDTGSVIKLSIHGSTTHDCRSLSVHKVDCGPVSNWTSVGVGLFDGNDTATVNGLPNIATTITGNAGNDTLIGGDGPDYLKAGPGDDYLDGRGGANSADVGMGTDTVVIHPNDWIVGLLDDFTDTCIEEGFTAFQPINGCDFYATP